MEYRIRLCEEKDLPVLIELCAKHAAHEKAVYDAKDKERLLKVALFGDNPQLHCLVVEADENVVGYASFTFDYSTWSAASFLHLDCLYLDECYRGYGIGEAMILRIKEIAKANGCINVQWQTPVFNEKAIKFYKRIGGQSKDKVRFTMTV
ncbi:GCN5 family acetyltransferase [Sporocytophaga myxococcoides]|uniref:GCN5 family acetyltransferase n=1 Tax=Sporocytophaga myxococcoides TaxID=153721 RepID=A0A098LHC9_9BACT|nr:GNAT family N-acetyltransferase [Sporocytophaga myxococcoides]GAL85822.1 GCN5 family acetyltransferase [Sporocytophaga myxococcoides]